jgi:hypothetical protein
MKKMTLINYVITMASSSVSDKEYNHLALAARTLFNKLIRTRDLMEKTDSPNFQELLINIGYKHSAVGPSIKTDDVFHFNSVFTLKRNGVIESLERLRFKPRWSVSYLVRMKYILVWAKHFFFTEYDEAVEEYYDELEDELMEKFSDPGMIIFDYLFQEKIGDDAKEGKTNNADLGRSLPNAATHRRIISSIVDKVMQNIPVDGMIPDEFSEEDSVVNFFTVFEKSSLNYMICRSAIYAPYNDLLVQNFVDANPVVCQNIIAEEHY